MSKNIEFRSIIEAEIPRQPLPPRARARVEETYRLLGAQRSAPKHHFRKGLMISLSSVAACFLLLFGTNAAFPAFAEGLPVVGQWFRDMNSRSTYEKTLLQGKTIEGTYVADYGTETINAVSESGNYKMTIEDGFCDGENVTFSMRMELPKEEAEPIEYALPRSLSLSVNGEDAGLEVNDIILFPDGGDGRLIGAVTTALPQSVADGEALQISCSMSDFGGKDTSNKDFTPCIPMGASFSLDFSLTANLSQNKAFSCDVEDNGIKLLNLDARPTITRLKAVMPGTVSYDGDSVLLLENGTKLHLNRAKSADNTADNTTASTIEEFLADEHAEIDLSFDGIPADTKKLIFRQYNNAMHEKVLAEFTLDLENCTAETSKTYEEDGVLALNGPFDYDFLHSEGALEGKNEYNESKAVNGLQISNLYWDSHDHGVSLHVYQTSAPYREIKAEVLNTQGNVVAEKVSENSSVCNSSCKTWYFDENYEGWNRILEFGEEPHYAYNFYTVSDYLPAFGEVLTVRITDNQTGEVLATKDLTMNEKSQ